MGCLHDDISGSPEHDTGISGSSEHECGCSSVLSATHDHCDSNIWCANTCLGHCDTNIWSVWCLWNTVPWDDIHAHRLRKKLLSLCLSASQLRGDTTLLALWPSAQLAGSCVHTECVLQAVEACFN